MVKNLWKLDRNAQGDARGDGKTPSQPVDSNYQTVGTTLRLRREERGEDLRYVAQILRIRYPYLKAIEDGRPDELPGPTYAIGFVRTYADHLGLESDKLVQRFKAEAEGLHARADLHFPAPLPEGKIPSGAVLVVAVVLAAFVYGAWIYLSSREQQVAEIVPQLPNRISDIIRGKSSAPVVSPQAAGSITEAPAAAGLTAKSPNPATAPEAPKASSETHAATSAAMSPAMPKTTGSGVDTSAAAPAPAGMPAASSPATAAPAPASAGDSAAATADSDSSESDVPPVPSDVTSDQLASREDGAPTEGTPGPMSEAERGPAKVYGEENANAHIVIFAAADSWVEIRDTKTDELLLTRVLFKGDSYRVPDRSGLTLLTGNAGGLRIAVDGQDVPAIGPIGAVRRNVVLDSGALKAGKASAAGEGSRTSGPPPQ
jgi:cytoskeleton protein RodZ